MADASCAESCLQQLLSLDFITPRAERGAAAAG